MGNRRRLLFFMFLKEVIIGRLRSTGKSGNIRRAMYFGLSLRQFICAVLACGVAVGLYFLLRPHMGMETVSWVCMLGAAPFAAIGFIKYHGMTAEKFLWVWIKSEILMPKYLVFHPENLYYELIRTRSESRKRRRWESMLRTLKTVMRQDKEKFKIPKSVQQAIPIQTIWERRDLSGREKQVCEDVSVYGHQL